MKLYIDSHLATLGFRIFAVKFAALDESEIRVYLFLKHEEMFPSVVPIKMIRNRKYDLAILALADDVDDFDLIY